MLRVRRSVEASYNVNVTLTSVQMRVDAERKAQETTSGTVNPMDTLDTQTSSTAQDGGSILQASLNKGNVAFVRGASKTVAKETTENPDEIDLGDDDDEEEEEEENDGEEMEVDISTKTVPAQIFGSLKQAEEEEEEA
uniref:Uncharacterized protein n=1 Tax=Caenorhabditis japonica TaxID=281687 RepID=A0A8R1EJI1_CAEJA